MALNEIRKRLKLNSSPFQALDDDLLRLAFTPRDVALPKEIAEKIIKYFGTSNYEFFETFGDKILDVIIINLVLWQARSRPEMFGLSPSLIIPGGLSPFQLNKWRMIIGSNTNLECLMDTYNVCVLVERLIGRRLKVKECADMLEALIGVLYVYLEFLIRHPNSIGELTKWFTSVWSIEALFDRRCEQVTEEKNPIQRIAFQGDFPPFTGPPQLADIHNKPIISICDYPYDPRSLHVELPMSEEREKLNWFVSSHHLGIETKLTLGLNKPFFIYPDHDNNQFLFCV